MINFDELKQKAIDAVTVLTGKASDVKDKAEAKAKEVAKTTQLNAEIIREKGNIKKLTAELGAMYYQLHKSEAPDDLKQLIDEIAGAEANIADLQAQLDEMKADDDIEVDVVIDLTDEDTCDCCCDEAPAEEYCCADEAPAEDCGCGCADEEKGE